MIKTETMSPRSVFENLLPIKKEQVTDTDRISEESESAESETSQMRAKRQTRTYRYHCSVRTYETAKDLLNGKLCNERCNESCLFCKSHHKYGILAKKSTSAGLKYWYSCKNKSCSSKFQVMELDSHFRLMIANESAEHKPIKKYTPRSSIDSEIQKKIIELNDLGLKPSQIQVELKENGFDELPRHSLSNFLQKLRKLPQAAQFESVPSSENKQVPNTDRTLEESESAESETSQMRQKRQIMIYKYLCSVRTYETAKSLVNGKLCNDRCNESCLFCKSHHKYGILTKNSTSTGLKYWYSCKNKSCSSKIQVMELDSHFRLMIKNESDEHEAVAKNQNVKLINKSSIDSEAQKKIIELNKVGLKPSQILDELKESGFELPKNKLSRFLYKLRNQPQVTHLESNKMEQLNQAASMSIAIQVIRNLKRKADMDTILSTEECKRARTF